MAIDRDPVAETRFAAPEGYALWVAAGTVAAGSTLEWNEDHGDEALYLESGSVELVGEDNERPLLRRLLDGGHEGLSR